LYELGHKSQVYHLTSEVSMQTGGQRTKFLRALLLLLHTHTHARTVSDHDVMATLILQVIWNRKMYC